jgi:hypothetical protein
MMMRTRRALLTIVVLAGVLAGSGRPAQAADAQTCEPGILDVFFGPRQPQYTAVYTALAPEVAAFSTQLGALVGQTPTYDTLLAHANTVAALLPTGRIVITIPDGTVVVDTGKGALNTYANYLAKAINENHNTRIAIHAAQAYACGVALETKLSSTVGAKDSYVAIRLGNFLDSNGTVRMSVTAP